MALPVNHPLNEHVITINWPDSSGTTSCFAVAPYKGKIVKAKAVLQGQTIGTANNVLGMKIATVAVTIPTWTQLTSGSAAGDTVSVVPTANNDCNEDDLIEITSDGGGSNTCPTMIYLHIRV